MVTPSMQASQCRVMHVGMSLPLMEAFPAGTTVAWHEINSCPGNICAKLHVLLTAPRNAGQTKHKFSAV